MWFYLYSDPFIIFKSVTNANFSNNSYMYMWICFWRAWSSFEIYLAVSFISFCRCLDYDFIVSGKGNARVQSDSITNLSYWQCKFRKISLQSVKYLTIGFLKQIFVFSQLNPKLIQACFLVKERDLSFEKKVQVLAWHRAVSVLLTEGQNGLF